MGPAQSRLGGLCERNERGVGLLKDHPGGWDIFLAIVIHCWAPRRIAQSRSMYVAAHQEEVGSAQDTGGALFQQGEVCVRADGGDDRALLDVPLKQGEGV